LNKWSICALLVMRIEEDRPRLNVYKNRFLTYGLFYCFRFSSSLSTVVTDQCFYFFINKRYINPTFFIFYQSKKTMRERKSFFSLECSFTKDKYMSCLQYLSEWLVDIYLDWHILFPPTYINILLLRLETNTIFSSWYCLIIWLLHQILFKKEEIYL